MRLSTRVESLIALLLVTYLALAFAYSLASPIYEPTDELRHFRYVRHITVYRSLPVQQPDAPRAQSHHPPLYYALGALVSSWVDVEQEVYYSPQINPHWSDSHWEVSTDNKNQYVHGLEERPPFRGVTLAVYVVRWMTALIGAGVVWLTYKLVRALSPQRSAIAVGGAAIVAFNPQFLHLSSAINNDIAAAFCGAAVIFACIHLVKNGPHLRYDVILGVLYGLALLTKFNLLALVAPIALAYILAAQRHKTTGYNWRALLRGAIVILGLTALISGWWFMRNARLYGDPTGMKMVNELWAGRPASGHWWAVRQSLPYLWSSLWGRFGYGQLPLPRFIYRALLGFFILALAGHLIPPRLVQSRRLNQSALAENSALILLITILAFVAVVFYYIMIQPAGAMGRFLFPALPSFAALAMIGLARFFPRRLSWLGGMIVTLGMATLALYALIGVLAPAFAPPRPLRAKELHNLPNPTRIEWRMENGEMENGEMENGESSIARLLGYRVEPTTVEPGDALEVTLYWQALNRPDQNLNVFVHLLSDMGTMVAQRDTYPGLGRYPTTAWETGVAFADTYRLRIPETAYTPDSGYVQIGLYVPDGPRLVTDDGRDALRLATVEIQPRTGELPNPLEVNFGTEEGLIALVGYKLAPRTAQPGEKIKLTLYWHALAPMETDYHVFTHILSEGSDQMWGQSDSRLTADSAPTSEWQAGMTVEDVHELELGLTTPSGFYDIEVGLYRPGEDRLPVIAEDGHWLGDRTLLSKIRVVSE